MDKQNGFNNNFSTKRIFLSPLDWGLGHATRCIPIIKALSDKGFTVIIGADKATFLLLKNEFPQLDFIKIKGYGVTYSRKKGGFYLKMLLQLPRIFTVFLQERRQLSKIIRNYSIDAVISDNRFGLYSKSIPCIYITHQVAVKTGHSVADKWATLVHQRIIKKFNYCWIPDNKFNGLGGVLSHPEVLPSRATYIGALSRFKLLRLPRKYDLLIIISGPEPQRSIFENLLVSQCQHLSLKILFIRGLPGNTKKPVRELPHVTFKNHLKAEALNKALCQADMVISRSGYTTIMDLVKLQKKAILVPTPGQAEQEYLAQYLMEKRYFYTERQADFNLKKALLKAAEFQFTLFPFQEEQYKEVIDQFAIMLAESEKH